MTNVLEISAPLKRHIKKGAQYAGLLPRVSCEATNLGDGSNNTIEGVDFMTQWIKKYSWQTEKLTAALLREGKVSKTDLAKTANGIYNFLYNHIQYTADGALQQLRSPACAWQQRFDGVDCKSYTIFTMCILQNLGITAAIRQVKQPGFYPEQFTHVYVVIPVNQQVKQKIKGNYLIIDATKHSNVESDFVDYKDKIMSGLRYQGLNAPVGGDDSLKLEMLKDNFDDFCKLLINQGFSLSRVNEVRVYFSQYTKKGVIPTLKTYNNGVMVGDKFFPADNEKGLGVAAAGALAAGKALGLDKKLGGIFKSLTSKIGDFFSKIFSGHIDCIGGSGYPLSKSSKDQKVIRDKLTPKINAMRSAIKSGNYDQLARNYAFVQASLKLLKDAYTVSSKSTDWNSCSREGFKATLDLINTMNTMIDSFGSSLKSNFKLRNSSTVTVNLGKDFEPLWLRDEDNMSASFTVFKMTPLYSDADVSVPDFGTGTGTGGGIDSGDHTTIPDFNIGDLRPGIYDKINQGNNEGTITGDKPKAKAAGFGGALLPLGLVLGLVFLGYSEKKAGEKEAKRKAAKKKNNSKHN